MGMRGRVKMGSIALLLTYQSSAVERPQTGPITLLLMLWGGSWEDMPQKLEGKSKLRGEAAWWGCLLKRSGHIPTFWQQKTQTGREGVDLLGSPLHHPKLINANDPPEWRTGIWSLMRQRKRKEDEGGDRWTGQEASSPEGEICWAYICFSLPSSSPSPLLRVQMGFLSPRRRLLHGLPGC